MMHLLQGNDYQSEEAQCSLLADSTFCLPFMVSWSPSEIILHFYQFLKRWVQTKPLQIKLKHMKEK